MRKTFANQRSSFKFSAFASPKDSEMAFSPICKSSYHARSISLPSRPHPIADQFEEHLCRLRSSEAASTSSSSLSCKISSLSNLYHCLDELLQLPLTQQNLSQNKRRKWVEDVLDGSLSLLDLCGMSRDILLQSKGCLQDIQSVLRRRCSGELSITNEVVEYLKTRKVARKAIKKCLKSIKEADKCDEENAIVGMLKDAEEISADIMSSLLSDIAGVKLHSRKSSWSILSKLTHGKDNKEKAKPTSFFAAVDPALDSLTCQEKKSGINMSHIENMRSEIIKLESEIQDLVEALECLSRHLIKTRAYLLNILSN